MNPKKLLLNRFIQLPKCPIPVYGHFLSKNGIFLFLGDFCHYCEAGVPLLRISKENRKNFKNFKENVFRGKIPRGIRKTTYF